MLPRCLFLALLGFAAPICALGSPTPPPATAPVAPGAQFFDLDQVRLGPGPFQIAEETDEAYLLKLEPDRFLAWFRKEAGLTPKAKVYGGWESQGVAGHDGGHYMSALAQMYAATGNPEFKRRADYMVGELALCQQANGKRLRRRHSQWQKDLCGNQSRPDQYAGQSQRRLGSLVHHPQGIRRLLGRLSLLPQRPGAGRREEIRRLGRRRNRRALPRSDAAHARDRARRHDRGPGHLYGDTGDARYLALAEKFRHDHVFVPLAQGRDVLTGLHANTQIPKFIGYERVYELTGDAEWHDAAENFWKTVTENRAWVIGGNSENEHFFAPAAFEAQMNDTVATGKLQLLQHAQAHRASLRISSRRARDGLLRAHALQPHPFHHPAASGWLRLLHVDESRFLPLLLDRLQRFLVLCRHRHGKITRKYGKAIYAHEGGGKLLVNLFIASTLDWPEAGLKVEQKTAFPEEQGSTLVFHATGPKPMEVDVRYPAWVAARARSSSRSTASRSPSRRSPASTRRSRGRGRTAIRCALKRP